MQKCLSNSELVHNHKKTYPQEGHGRDHGAITELCQKLTDHVTNSFLNQHLYSATSKLVLRRGGPNVRGVSTGGIWTKVRGVSEA